MKITILGAGMVGRVMALDLATQFSVLAVDRDLSRLEMLQGYDGITTRHADLADSRHIEQVIADCDLVIGAVPGYMGYRTLETVIRCGKNIVDISFFNEDPFTLHKLACEKGVIAIVDCGVAPGMGNIILGYYNQQIKINRFECYVGGLPLIRTWPFEYKAPFSPIDVLEEYTRPARLVENGALVIKPALSEPELLNFPGIGTLEAFNTDGLRSLLTTMNIPNMKEKTLRYPGHIEIMRIFRETGFFGTEKIDINGSAVRPLDVTTKLLFPLWKLAETEHEFTVMKIILTGTDKHGDCLVEYDMLDRYDEKTGISSMARTTGYTCTAAARLVLNGDYRNKGISPPERLGEDEKCFIKMLDDLAAHNIHYIKSK
ncbi:MAG TPA: saccharopine dehydrogenase C-terminal domain-containing protein [bacterium]|nr:saccharopine dehydrogenase C-terminal domain-containing protein [bacterium]HPN44110.1 saccharopine dehydrogenase C-terminal domain-containing protein [bacterium]